MRRFIALTFILLLTVATAACGSGSIFSPSTEMTVLAGSELKDLQPYLDEIERNTEVRLNFTYVGTLDGAERIASGAVYDLGWFSHSKYLTLLLDQQGRRVSQEQIMLSPVVMGVKRSVAEEFGWVDNGNITWQEIADKAAAGELDFAMTNPASSNSGFTSLVGVAAAFSGATDALNVDDVDQEAMQDFFSGQKLTAGSSGWLADSYLEAQDELDGIINYESVLLQMNKSGNLREELVLIYPREGIITADYPIMLLNSEMREEYDRLVEYLLSEEFQRLVMEETTRRPVIPQVRPDDQFPDQLIVELPFPNQIDVIDELILTYLDEQRIPSHAIFVLDTSGSMAGSRIEDLKTSLINLTASDGTISGQFARFRGRERVTFIPFSSFVLDNRLFEVNETDADSADMVAIRDYVNTLQADGGTAIFSSLRQAYQVAMMEMEEDPDRYYSIVIMSDGANNEGISESDFNQFYFSLPPEAQNVRTFAILFGDADEASMERITEMTGGRVFDAKEDSLSFVFKNIRGYQ